MMRKLPQPHAGSKSRSVPSLSRDFRRSAMLRNPPFQDGTMTPGATPAPSVPLQPRFLGGSLPSSLSPLARFGSSGPGENTKRRRGKMEGCLLTPPPLARQFLLAPGLAPRFDPGGVQTTGQHQIATSGVVSRTVDHVEKRSMAPRAVVLVGAPSGSWLKCRNR